MNCRINNFMNKLSGNHQTISSLSVPSNPGWPYFDIKTGKPEINKLDKWYWKQQKEHKPGEDLNEIRNIRAIRIPKNIIDQIVAHPNSISLFYYLAAKPLYLSGRIHKQGDKAAYKRLAEFFQISDTMLFWG